MACSFSYSKHFVDMRNDDALSTPNRVPKSLDARFIMKLLPLLRGA